jgi:HD-GYP domain-containing protein (c-di-GMP phosphodiesterase class II)
MDGMIILNAIPNAGVEQKVGEFLSCHTKNIPVDKLKDMIKKTPLILSKNANEKNGKTFVSKLEMLGASAIYVSKPSLTKQDTTPQQIPIEQASNLSMAQENTHPEYTNSKAFARFKQGVKGRLFAQLIEVNKELWLILSMIMIVGVMNYLLASQRMLLGLYTLPTLFSAYFFGRRHATLTALASVLIVSIAIYYNPSWLVETKGTTFLDSKWFEIIAWGGILMITGYAMGTLYDRVKNKMTELRQTYQGVLVILRNFISNDEYTENHCYRVSIYAAKIASYLGFSMERIEDIRSAALLHDIGKLEISRNLLYKAARLSKNEYGEMKQHVAKSGEILSPLQGPLGRILPIILAHHEKHDGSGYNKVLGEKIPLEARVLAVADVYDSLTSDRPYRKAMSPYDAKDIIAKGSGTEFDPEVVEVFLKVFAKGELEIPNVAF